MIYDNKQVTTLTPSQSADPASLPPSSQLNKASPVVGIGNPLWGSFAELPEELRTRIIRDKNALLREELLDIKQEYTKDGTRRVIADLNGVLYSFSISRGHISIHYASFVADLSDPDDPDDPDDPADPDLLDGSGANGDGYDELEFVSDLEISHACVQNSTEADPTRRVAVRHTGDVWRLPLASTTIPAERLSSFSGMKLLSTLPHSLSGLLAGRVYIGNLIAGVRNELVPSSHYHERSGGAKAAFWVRRLYGLVAHCVLLLLAFQSIGR